jgi:hypothetical protein
MRRLGMEKKHWVLFALLESYKIFRAALNKCTMFVHDEKNLAFLDRLSQRQMNKDRPT